MSKFANNKFSTLFVNNENIKKNKNKNISHLSRTPGPFTTTRAQIRADLLAAQANLPRIPTLPPRAPPAPYVHPKEVQVRIINEQLDKLYDDKRDLQDHINKFKQDKNHVLGRVATPKVTPATNEGRKSDLFSFSGRAMEGVHNTGRLYTSCKLNRNCFMPDIHIHPDEYARRHERWQEGFETDPRNWGR
jgi:hypothetical protein